MFPLLEMLLLHYHSNDLIPIDVMFGILGNLLFLQKLKCSFTGTTSNDMGLHEHGILLKLNSSPLILPVWRCSIHQTSSLSPSSSLSLVSSLFSLDPHLVWNLVKLDRDTQLCRYVFLPLQVCPKTKWRIVLHLSKVIYLVTNRAQQGVFFQYQAGLGRVCWVLPGISGIKGKFDISGKPKCRVYPNIW